MALSPEETRRYARHIVLKGFGGTGQAALKSAHVAVIGAGGLGAPVIAYLAAAGVGRLTILDPDMVALSNLQRQIVYRTSDIGTAKAQGAARFVAALNPHVAVDAVAEALTRENAARLLAGVTLVVEGTDSFAAREMAAEICESLSIPLVSGAVTMFDGQVTVLAPYLSDGDGDGSPAPRFADLFAVAPATGELPGCEEVGVLGVLTGTIGTMMANEAIKLVTGYAEPLIGRLLIYSARSGQTRILRYRRRG